MEADVAGAESGPVPGGACPAGGLRLEDAQTAGAHCGLHTDAEASAAGPSLSVGSKQQL